MKFIIIIILFILKLNSASASEFLTYLESAYKNNPTLNAERENYKAIKEILISQEVNFYLAFL